MSRARRASAGRRVPDPAGFRLREVVPTEAQVLATVRATLEAHPAVARVARFNSGAGVLGVGAARRYVRYNDLPGCPDILGWLRGGRILAVECKRPGWTKPGDDRERQQMALLDEIRAAGGVAFVARGVEDVLRALAPCLPPPPAVPCQPALLLSMSEPA